MKRRGGAAFFVLCGLLAASSPASANVPNNLVTSASIVDFTIKTVNLAENIISSARLRGKSVITSKIQDGAVTSGKIADAAITSAKLAADAVTNAKMADNSVDTTNIIDGEVKTVDTNQIADAAITSAKLAANISVLQLGFGYAGGDSIITSTLAVIKSVSIVPSKSGYVFELDETSFSAGMFKVKAFQAGGTTGTPLAETSATTNLSALTGIRFEAIGTAP